MLSKNLRLDSKDIPFVAKRGKKNENDYFIVKSWFDDSLDSPKFAISISVKVDKRATVRNRIKRKVRASISDLIADNPNYKRGKYLIVVKSSALKDLDNNKIQELIKTN